MSRINCLLILFITVELLLGATTIGQRLARPAPPEPDWSLLDPDTAGEGRKDVDAARSSHRAADWQALGELYMAHGLFAESEMCHRIACERNPKDAQLARQWAFALERLALLDAANAQYRRSSDLQPAVADANTYFIGRNLLRMDKPAEARAVFADGLNLEANRYELARLHLRAGELAEAETAYQQLASEHPGDLQVHLLGYRLAMERGDARQAFARADNARYAPGKLFNPFEWEASRIIRKTILSGAGLRAHQARRLVDAERFDEAKAALVEAGQVHPRPGFNDLLAAIEFRRGHYQDAVALLEEWEAKNGPSARIADQLGDTWDAMGEPAKAREYWLRATRAEAGTNLKLAHQKLARSFAAAENKSTADWHTARENYYAGLELLRTGQTQKSAECFATATSRDPRLTQAWFYLGEARRRLGELGPAAEAYRTSLKLNPYHGRALAALAWIESGAGK